MSIRIVFIENNPAGYLISNFLFSGLSLLRHAFNGTNIMLQTVVPLWLASFFPVLGLGLALYTYTHRLQRITLLSVTRSIKVNMADTQTYMMLITADCLFAVNYLQKSLDN